MPPRPGGVAIAAISVGRRSGVGMRRHARERFARVRQRRFAAAAAVSRSSTRFMCHCWKICSELLTSQYSTRPDGKKMNITENAIGMICITFACTGSEIGVGDSFTCRYAVIA